MPRKKTFSLAAAAAVCWSLAPLPARAQDPASEAQGVTYQLINVNSGKVADVAGSSVQPGAQVFQFTYHGTKNQKWRVLPIEGGYWELANVNSGQALTVSENSTTSGAKCVQEPYTALASQQWALQNTGDGTFWIINRGSGQYLEVAGSAKDEAGTIDQWTRNGYPNQQWMMMPIDVIIAGAPASPAGGASSLAKPKKIKHPSKIHAAPVHPPQ